MRNHRTLPLVSVLDGDTIEVLHKGVGELQLKKDFCWLLIIDRVCDGWRYSLSVWYARRGLGGEAWAHASTTSRSMLKLIGRSMVSRIPLTTPEDCVDRSWGGISETLY